MKTSIYDAICYRSIPNSDYIIVNKDIIKDLINFLEVDDMIILFSRMTQILPTISDNNLGGLIKALRDKHGLTQEEFARLANLKQCDISNLENKAKIFGAKRKKKITSSIEKLLLAS